MRGDCLNRSETETREDPQPHPERPTDREHRYERQDQELGCRSRGNGDAGQVMQSRSEYDRTGGTVRPQDERPPLLVAQPTSVRMTQFFVPFART